MKKTGLYIIIIILILSFTAFEANAMEANDTVFRYLNALKHGDIPTIKDSITGEFYNKSKILLEQNKSYPKFLIKIYRDAEFQIKETIVNNNNVLIKVESKLPGGETRFILHLNKNAQGNWKIFKESMP